VDDLYLSGDAGLLMRRCRAERTGAAVLPGYAGWATQLDFEIAEGGWYVVPADLETVLKETRRRYGAIYAAGDSSQNVKTRDSCEAIVTRDS
jgi:putative AlgH/UPF0301 family transcriptional regulator